MVGAKRLSVPACIVRMTPAGVYGAPRRPQKVFTLGGTVGMPRAAVVHVTSWIRSHQSSGSAHPAERIRWSATPKSWPFRQFTIVSESPISASFRCMAGDGLAHRRRHQPRRIDHGHKALAQGGGQLPRLDALGNARYGCAGLGRDERPQNCGRRQLDGRSDALAQALWLLLEREL